jgi:hypothetical protein
MTQDPGAGAPMSERMQSLLSRAVEDQLSEQRQLAGALAEVRAQLAQLGSQLGPVQSGGGAPPHLDEALGAIAGNVREAVRLLGERLDTVARLVQERGHDLAEQRALIGELKAAVDRQTEALDGMTGGLAALPSFGERLETLSSGLGGLADRWQGLEEMTAAVVGLQQRSEAVDTDLRELRQAFTGVASRAAQLPGREDLEAVTSRVSESVDGLGGRLSRLETAVPSLLERFDALAGAHVDTKSTLLDIQARLEAQPTGAGAGELDGGDLAALQDEIAALRQHLGSAGSVGAGADLGALAQRLDALHEGLVGSGGIAERLDGLETRRGEAAPAGLGPSTVDAEEIEAAVARAVAASEQRLADHVDEAVLTLAEALLRRRARQRPSGLGAVLGAVEVESAVAGGDSGHDDELTTPQDLLDADNAGDLLDADDADDVEDDLDDLDDLDEDVDDDSSRFGRPVGTPWQTPSPGGAGTEDAAGDAGTDAGAGGGQKRRKPWWRPGV